MRRRPGAILLFAALLASVPSVDAGAAPFPRTAAFRDGVLHLDGRPRFLVSADYPYYRDHASRWGAKLDLLKAAGVEVVTFYTPWRHHQPRQGMTPDFAGATQANRDVVGFIRLIAARGMLAVVKPGPFVHSELNYGGLPDWVNPTRNTAIAPDADALGLPTSWLLTQEVLPDFFDPEFRRLTDAWMHAVAEHVIRPFEVPAGPVVAVQVLNERIYSDSGAITAPAALTSGGVTSSGYGAPRVADWGRRDPPRVWAQPATLAEAERYVSWGLHHGEDYREATETLLESLAPLRVPVVLNPAPDFNPAGLPGEEWASNGEDWLLRTEGDDPRRRWAIGYTNWVGVVMRQFRPYLLYVSIATRFPGPNIEENWGFGEIYDPAYKRAQPSVFQSVAFTAWGATGLNFYTGVSTDAFTADPALDDYRTRPYVGFGGVKTAGHSPYPDAAPITADDKRGHTYPAMRQLARLWTHVGDSLVRARPPRTMAWGVYPPYAAAGAWQSADEEWRALGLVGAPHSVFKGSEGFLSSAIATDTQAGQVHLPTATPAELARWRTLVLAGSRWMDRDTQRKLTAYVRGGGTLFMTGDVPVLGADMRTPDRTLLDALLPRARLAVRLHAAPMQIEAFGSRWRATGAVTVVPETGGGRVEASLRDGTPVAVSREVGAGAFVFAGWQPWDAPDHDPAQFAGSRGLAETVAARFARASPEPGDPSEQVEVNTYRDGVREHLFVLNRTPRPRTVETGRATVRVAGHGVAQLMLERDQIAAAYVDGANDLDPQASTEPRVAVGACTLGASGAADLLALGRETDLAYAGSGARVADGRDFRAPRTRIRSLRLARSSLTLRGRTADRGCARSSRALVSVWRRAGARCRFLTARGRLGAARSCGRPVRLAATRGGRFRLRRRVSLPRGAYFVTAVGRDAAGNVERRSRRNTVRANVR